MTTQTDTSLINQIEGERSAFDPTSLSPEQKEKVETLKATLNPSNPHTLLQYGVGAQKQISDFTSQILSKVKAKDSGNIGETLTELSVQVKKVDPNSLIVTQKGFLASIPGIGKFFDALAQFKAKYQTIESNINTITNRLESQYEMMLRDIIMFEKLYTENVGYYQQLNLILIAGEEREKELEQELKEAEDYYETTKNELDLEKVQNLRNYINQLETRLHDLELTRISTLQSFPQINMIKAADQGLAGKIQSAILNTIPLWKRHITIAIGLYNQEVVLKDLERVDETTQRLLVNNSEMLKTKNAQVARTLQKGIISVETLEIVQKNLLDSINEVRGIVAEGRKQREIAQSRIYELETELKEKLAGKDE